MRFGLSPISDPFKSSSLLELGNHTVWTGPLRRLIGKSSYKNKSSLKSVGMYFLTVDRAKLRGLSASNLCAKLSYKCTMTQDENDPSSHLTLPKCQTVNIWGKNSLGSTHLQSPT